MRELRRKIKRLEAEMNQDRVRITAECGILDKFTHSTVFVAAGITAGFVGGFLLARKKNIPEIISMGRKVKRGVGFLKFFVL